MAIQDCKDMKWIGKLRHRVTIQEFTSVRKTGGGRTKTWADLTTVWAHVMPKAKDEIINAMQLEGATDHVVTIRYRDEVNTNQRIKFGSRYFSIKSLVNIEEKGRFLEIEAREVNEASESG